MRGLEGLRFLYVTGKGGVGKSTVAAALSVRLAQQGRRVLLVSEAGSLGQARLLGVRPDLQPVQVREHLYCMAIDADQAMRQYAEAILRSRRLVDMLFHNQVARGFLGGIPGLSAWAFLGKAWSFAEDRWEGPRHEIDGIQTVVVDAPATGDGTDILRVPTIISDLAPRGRFRRDAELCAELLSDPARTAIVPVTVLEELPVTETEELLSVVEGELAMPLGPLFLNRVRPELFSPEEGELLQAALDSSSSEDGISQTLALAARRGAAEAQARELTDRLQTRKIPLVCVPEVLPEPAGAEALERLALALAEGPPPSYRAERP